MKKTRFFNKLNNAGMSLIELIVVILILGIVSTGAVISISAIMNANVSSCAKKLSSLLDKTRLETMSRTGNVYLKISQDASGTYHGTIINKVGTDEKELTKESLGSRNITINAYTSDINYSEVSDSNSVIIEFNKGSGSLKSSFVKFEITSSKTANVYIVEETGRNYID